MRFDRKPNGSFFQQMEAAAGEANGEMRVCEVQLMLKVVLKGGGSGNDADDGDGCGRTGCWRFQSIGRLCERAQLLFDTDKPASIALLRAGLNFAPLATQSLPRYLVAFAGATASLSVMACGLPSLVGTLNVRLQVFVSAS